MIYLSVKKGSIAKDAVLSFSLILPLIFKFTRLIRHLKRTRDLRCSAVIRLGNKIKLEVRDD